MIQRRTLRRLRGFTLLEVLITVTLVALLTGFLAVQIGRSITQAKITATRTTLQKIDSILKQRLQAFRELMDTGPKQKEIKDRGKVKVAELKALGIRDVNNDKIRELMAYKDLYRRAFPQMYADSSSLAAAGFTGNAADKRESSEILYWLLTQGETYGVPSIGDNDFSSSEIADTDGDGRMEFVDAWGEPLRFYRWPTRLLRPDGLAVPGTPVDVNRRKFAGMLINGLPPRPPAGDFDQASSDPDDRLGAFLTESLRQTAGISPTQFEGLYHTAETYHTPLILSGGPDRITGMLEPYDPFGRLASPMPAIAASVVTAPPNTADFLDNEMNDNLTNLQVQK